VTWLERTRDPGSTQVRDAMSDRRTTVDPAHDIDEAMRLMAEHRVRRRLVGMLAQADVARHGDEARTGETVQRISS
jgi:CBS domain-containing protein